MSIKKLEDGRYLLDIRPNGRKGKRVRKVFDKKSVAVVLNATSWRTLKSGNIYRATVIVER